VNPETNEALVDDYGNEDIEDPKVPKVTCESLRNTYRDYLVESAYAYYNKKMSKSFIRRRVHALLPDDRFYFFKLQGSGDARN
jgi:hypothetical protein